MKLLSKLVLLELSLWNELMERWVEETECNRHAVHYLHCTLNCSLDEWLELCKSSLTLIISLCKDQLAEQLREEIIQEIICLLKREGIDSLTFSECMEDYASTIWFDRHDFPCWSRITGIKVVDTGLMIHCGDEDISIYTNSDYGARNISTLCDILYVVKETIEQTPVLKSCKIMGEYLNSKGQGTIEFCDEPALFIEGQRKIIRQFSINEQGNLIGIKTDEQGYCFDLTPTKDNTPAFLENMLRETGMEDLLGHAFYKVNDNQEAIFEYFINQKLSEQ